MILSPATLKDVEDLAAIRSKPEVFERWRGEAIEDEIAEDIKSDEIYLSVIRLHDQIVGAIQWSEETDPDYKHATVDVFVDPEFHRKGIATQAIRQIVEHIFAQGHHRITIDPAADNHAAISCYKKIGFQEVGVMKQYEKSLDGTWHDGLLMELLKDQH